MPGQLMHELPVHRSAAVGDRCGRWSGRWTLLTWTTSPAPRPRPGRRSRRPSRRRPCASAHRVCAVGHAHIDSAWLWPLRETVRKVARTASNVTALMDDHPEFVFAMSSAQQFAWIKEHRPQVCARVAEKVEAGQFVPVGGMWVESDTNMPGGEALARQFVHGKRFFLDEFGVETEEVWLPDSFGYSRGAAAAGDAVRVALVPHPEDLLEPDQPVPAPHVLVGGHRRHPGVHPLPAGGHLQLRAVRVRAGPRWCATSPTRAPPTGRWCRSAGATAAAARPGRCWPGRARLADLEGSARVQIETPGGVLRQGRTQEYPDAPVWVGELYLELHRGTYTSQAKTKQGNRRSEHLLREAELWAATAAVRTGHPYPYEELDRIWKTVLLHQFHDILPGSSIAWVHREAGRPTGGRRPSSRRSSPPRRRRWPATRRRTPRWCSTRRRTPAAGSPAGGAGRPRPAPAAVDLHAEPDGGYVLDNGVLRVAVDGRGLLTSVLDLAARREVVAPGAAGNLLQLHPDLPPTGTPGTSTPSTATRSPTWSSVDELDRSTTAEDGCRRGAGGAPVRRVHARRRSCRWPRAPRGSTSTPRSTGTSGEVPQGGVPARRARRPVGGRDPVRHVLPGHRTPTPAGRRPSSRSARTAACTSPSPATASRWSTTPPTATT